MRALVIFISAFLSTAVLMAADEPAAVAPSAKRNVTLDLARQLLITKSISITPEEINDANFFSLRKSTEEMSEIHDKRLASRSDIPDDRTLLKSILSGVNPSGMMQLGGSPILLFGQKKFKVGDIIPIVFQGANYELVITSIERTSFTVRFNKEEITRPIKPLVTTKP